MKRNSRSFIIISIGLFLFTIVLLLPKLIVQANNQTFFLWVPTILKDYTTTSKTLTIATVVDVENFNLRRVTSAPSFSVLGHIYEPLFYMTPEGELIPLLAESIEPITGESSYLIHLRQGVQFTDGEPFNAEVVKANLDWILANGTPFGFLINNIQEVIIVDEYKVQLNLVNDFAPLAAHLAHGAIGMISPQALEQGEEWLNTNAVGTGSYILDDWQPNQAVTLSRNTNYWGEAPPIDTIVFKVISDTWARIAEIEAGTVDVAVNIPPSEIDRIENHPNVELKRSPSLRTIYIFFNVTEEPFTDVRVRQAVNYAVDVEGIIQDLFHGAARVSNSPVAPPVFGYSPQEVYQRDIDLAKALLEDANVPEGTTVVLYHTTGRYFQDVLVAEAVKAQIEETGLNVELITLEWPQYVPKVLAPKPENDIQFAMLSWGTVTMDADYGLYPLFHSTQHPPGFNGAFYENSEIDNLLDEARTVFDPTTRRQLYAEAIEIIWNDAPWLFLYSEMQLTAVRSNIEGLIVHPTERLIVSFANKN